MCRKSGAPGRRAPTGEAPCRRAKLLVASRCQRGAVRFARTEVRARLVAAAKVARIEVEDDGVVPSEDATGDAFGHTHAGTSRSARTSRRCGGIGPVLVRSLVAAHGGTLRAEKLRIDGLPRGVGRRELAHPRVRTAGDRALTCS